MTYWNQKIPFTALINNRSLRLGGALCLFVVSLLVFSPSPQADAAEAVSRREFLSQLLQARGFPYPQGISDPADAALQSDLVPSFQGEAGASITRKEAVVFAVHSLGLFHEAGMLQSMNLPFRDIGRLSPSERGYLAAAYLMRPQMVKKGSSSFGPEKKLTPAQAKDILAAVRSAQKNLVLSVKYAPVKGMSVRIERTGTYSSLPKWRAAVNGFDSREEAELLRDALSGLGIESTVDSRNYDWRVRSLLSDVYGPVRDFLKASESLGKKGVVFYSGNDWDAENAPRSWIMVTIDPGMYDLRPLFPPAGLSALAPLSVLASGADAAINGGFYSITGKESGSPIGILMDLGVLASPPYRGRTILGWNSRNKASFEQLEWIGEVHFPGGGFMEITAVNRNVRGEGVVLFTPHFGEMTPQPQVPAVEAVLDGTTCVEIRHGGGAPIPPGRRVVSFYGSSSRFASALSSGDQLKIVQKMQGGSPAWGSMTYAIQGGPLLVRKGAVLFETESLSDGVVSRRHPRTAIGLTGSGQWFFFVGDGRNAVHSVGFTLAETADILKKNGAAYALNLDGGGSSSVFLRGRVLNSLSDGRERPVSYGIGAFRKGVNK